MARVLPGDAMRASEYGPRYCVYCEDTQNARLRYLHSSNIILVGIGYFT